ncbi:hypothetical protein PISMIDRAFT_237805 [Pisolithus microcarpus 441]|uniref:Uncharacterized protein n=1 Tax=Pisolithus microcarpus 441 TaxID=765257 RepID=A0A0C9ZB06_9AGAM|nr:hypothetical protein PISMIDRAFT_237805 [Pisolithus microcarpus 441]
MQAVLARLSESGWMWHHPSSVGAKDPPKVNSPEKHACDPPHVRELRGGGVVPRFYKRL